MMQIYKMKISAHYGNFFLKKSMKNYVNYVNFCLKNDHREPSPMINFGKKYA